MCKKTKLFALKLAMSLVVIMTLSLHAWAFNTYRTHDPDCGDVDTTVIIGFQNQSWHYIVNNISYREWGLADGLVTFGVPFLNISPVGLVSSIQSPPNFTTMNYPEPLNYVEWNCVGVPQGSILPGSTAEFSFQTNKITGVGEDPGRLIPGPMDKFVGLVPASLPEGPANATITEVEGIVEVLPSGTSTWIPATVGMALSLRDEVRTADNGYATIQLDEASTLAGNSPATIQADEASTLRMEPGSAQRFASIAAATTFLDMIYGKIRYKFVSRLKKLEVRTFSGCGAVRGTEFSVEHREVGGRQTTTVSVQSGEVEWADLSGGKLGAITIVPAGTTYTTPSGALPFLLPLLLGD